jgi:putative DNA primase/helicase
MNSTIDRAPWETDEVVDDGSPAPLDIAIAQRRSEPQAAAHANNNTPAAMPDVATVDAAGLSAPAGTTSPDNLRQHRPPVSLNLGDFLKAMTVPRDPLLSPILSRQSLAMLHAKRGVGKTYLALAIGVAVASGTALLKWTTPTARKVLYIDGEMPAAVVQDRLRSLSGGLTVDPENFRIINAESSDDWIPNLSTPEGQRWIEPDTDAADLIIVDNLATLNRYGKENEAESWHPMQDWLLGLRRRGKSVLLVHHSNKGGMQRGTSSREDILDVVIGLAHPPDYEPRQGARFIVTYEKARGLYGDDASSFEVSLALRDNAASWNCRSLEDTVAADVAELKEAGKSFREIAAELGISKSAAQRAFQAKVDAPLSKA